MAGWGGTSGWAAGEVMVLAWYAHKGTLSWTFQRSRLIVQIVGLLVQEQEKERPGRESL